MRVGINHARNDRPAAAINHLRLRRSELFDFCVRADCKDAIASNGKCLDDLIVVVHGQYFSIEQNTTRWIGSESECRIAAEQCSRHRNSCCFSHYVLPLRTSFVATRFVKGWDKRAASLAVAILCNPSGVQQALGSDKAPCRLRVTHQNEGGCDLRWPLTSELRRRSGCAAELARDPDELLEWIAGCPLLAQSRHGRVHCTRPL